jgi:ribA/ribD-fused uncharacterized protein
MTQHYDIEWLKGKFDKGLTIKFIFFWGHTNKHKEDVGNFCFSQWYETPFIVENVTYKTAEHWMMAQKALLFKDEKTFDQIIKCDKPGEAKELGRQVQNFEEGAWNEKRFSIVKAGNIHKFNQHPKFATYLIDTGERVLVEASPVDTIWGIGLAKDSTHIQNPYKWRGQNLLGFALMEVRDILSQIASKGGIKTWKALAEEQLQATMCL